ncbi:MAG: DUF1127 domain-containing protein [Hyphomicrobiales bacterium]|nr:MAG: DUF1127 domain-containing protein [Hyphomicrobiales bacterium]
MQERQALSSLNSKGLRIMHNTLVLQAPPSAARTVVSRLVSSVKGTASMVVTALAINQERHELMQLDDRMLADIGLTRHDVGRETSKGFWDIR